MQRGLGEVSSGRTGRMRRGAEISCSDPGWDEMTAISTLTLMCCPEPACESKSTLETSSWSSAGFGQAREAAGTPTCLWCGQAG